MSDNKSFVGGQDRARVAGDAELDAVDAVGRRLAALERAVEKCLRKDPAGRYAVDLLTGPRKEGEQRALLASYHRIDADQTSSALWLEAEAARAWMRSTTGDDIAASRSGVMARGRTQVRP